MTSGGLAAVSSSAFAALYSAFGKYDVVHIHAEGPAFFAWLPKMFGKRVVVTVHGIDCYECPYATTERKTDMTIGDFWHIEETIPDFYDSNGNSLFLIHTNRGEELFEKIQSELDYRSSNTTQCWQANLEAPTQKSEQREEFWNDYKKKGIDFVMKKYGSVPVKTKIKNKLLKIMGGGTQKVVPIMLITPKGGQHNELEAA